MVVTARTVVVLRNLIADANRKKDVTVPLNTATVAKVASGVTAANAVLAVYLKS